MQNFALSLAILAGCVPARNPFGMVRIRFNRRLTKVLYHLFRLSLTSNCRWSQIQNERGDILMKQSFFGVIGAALLLFSLSAPASRSFAEEAVQDGASYPVSQQRRPGFIHILGSVVFTTLHLPLKIVTCAGTQATAAVAYTATFGVEGQLRRRNQWQRHWRNSTAFMHRVMDRAAVPGCARLRRVI